MGGECSNLFDETYAAHFRDIRPRDLRLRGTCSPLLSIRFAATPWDTVARHGAHPLYSSARRREFWLAGRTPDVLWDDAGNMVI